MKICNIYVFIFKAPQDAVHITAILGESVVFNCHVEFPGDHPVPYVLQWEKKVSETVSIFSNNIIPKKTVKIQFRARKYRSTFGMKIIPLIVLKDTKGVYQGFHMILHLEQHR